MGGYNFVVRVYQSVCRQCGVEEGGDLFVRVFGLGRVGVLDDGFNPITMGFGCDLRLRLTGVSVNGLVNFKPIKDP